MDITLTTLIDLLGTFVFAVSGIQLASRKRLDWFGAYIIGLATAIGGGTTRDLLLRVTPFWMEDGKYFLATGAALLATLLWKNRFTHWGKTLFLFDSIGLGLFTVVGISKGLAAGLSPWVCIVMGTITGSVGGVVRDILLNEVPLLLRKDVYALACVAGGLVYFACYYFHLSAGLRELIAASTVITVRILAIKFHMHLPVLSSPAATQSENNP